MKKTTRILGILLCAIVLTNCDSNKSTAERTVKEIETCLGSAKTNKDLDKLDKEKAIKIVKCIIPHLEKIKEKGENLSEAQQEELGKALEEAVQKSEYKEIIISLDYETMKKIIREWDELEDSRSYIEEINDNIEKMNKR